MNLSLYLHRDTWIHRLDARTKVLSVLGFFILILVFSDPIYVLGIAVFVVGGIISAQVLTNIKQVWVLLVLLFFYSVVLWPFFVDEGTPMINIGSLVLTTQGIGFGLGMGLRLILMVISGILLLSTTTLEDFSLALQQFGLPSSMGFALSFAFRWVPTLLGASGTIVQAQRSRGLDLSSSSVVKKIRAYVPLVVPLIGHTLRQTTLLAMALESKGFAPGRRRNAYHQSSMKVRDFLVLLGMTSIVVASCWLRLKGFGGLEVGL